MNTRLVTLVFYSISGVCLGIGFVLPILSALGVIGVGFFAAAVARTTSWQQASLGGLLAGVVKSLFATLCLWSTYPILFVKLSLGLPQLSAIGLYWLLFSLFLGVGGIFVAVLWYIARKYLSLWWGAVVFSVLWVCGEVVGSLAFSVGTYGEGGSINTAFSFGYLGYLLGNHQWIILLAQWGGVYILSFCGALLGYVGWMYKERFNARQYWIGIGGLVLLGTATGFLAVPSSVIEDEEGKSVAIIDTTFGNDFFARTDQDSYKYTQVNEAVTAALELGTDYILLPEDSRFTNSKISTEGAYRLFRFQNSDTETVVIDTGRAELSSGEMVLRATIYDGVGKKGLAVDKQFLVPQGEFMPYLVDVSLRLFGQREMASGMYKKLLYRPGPEKSQAQLPAYIPRILFCFESTDPRGVRKLIQEREVPFVAHPMSHAWFHQSQLLWQQQDTMLKIQALWSDVSIVSAGNMVTGSLYTKSGTKKEAEEVAMGESWRVSVVRLPK